VSNNILAFNSTGIYVTGTAPVLRNNCLYNPFGSNYTGVTAGVGDIQADPMLVDPANANYHICADSPCREAGYNAAVQSNSIDIDGQPRIQPSEGTVDIGADESDGTAWQQVQNVSLVRVKPDGNDAYNGSTWSLAKRTVQAAINAAITNATLYQRREVWVAGDSNHPYIERITLSGIVEVYGGFAGTESVREQRDWNTNTTILDGNQAGKVVTCSADATIDGFTIRNGRSTTGGAIYCSQSSPKISHNIIRDNLANKSTVGGVGGGIYSQNGSPIISNNVICANVAEAYSSQRPGAGAGIYSYNGSPVITNNTITGNNSALGAGIYCTNTTQICNNIIAFNAS
jgi:hypothetical protein